MGRRGPKPKKRNHEYTKEHRDYILTLRATGLSYDQIPLKFRDKYGWEPSKSVVSRTVQDARNEVKKLERNGTVTEHNGTSQTPTDGTLPAQTKKKVLDTIEVRTYLVVQMMKIIQEDTIVEMNSKGERVSRDITAEEKIDRLKGLAPNIFKGLDGIDAASKVVTNVTVQGNAVFHMGAEDVETWYRGLTVEQRREFLLTIEREVCGRCRYKNSIEVK